MGIDAFAELSIPVQLATLCYMTTRNQWYSAKPSLTWADQRIVTMQRLPQRRVTGH